MPYIHYIVSEQNRSQIIENDTDTFPIREDHIWVPRRLIYGQAALLGVSAVTFFMLGIMVGNLTAPGKPDASANAATGFAEDCRISGMVSFMRNGRQVPDTGAVVLLLPKRVGPEKRLAPGLVMPNTFVALDNPTIEGIHNSGGAAVRADAAGKFDLLVDQGRDYRLLVLSRNRKSQGKELSEAQQMVVEKWFAPAEKLIRDNDFQWQDVSGNSEQVEVGEIEF